MYDKLINIIKKYYKDSKVCSLHIRERTNGEKSLSCTIDNETFYLGEFAYDCRKELWQLLNN